MMEKLKISRIHEPEFDSKNIFKLISTLIILEVTEGHLSSKILEMMTTFAFT